MVCLGSGIGPSMNLELVSLSSFPLAKCNDGTAAVYYRQPNINGQATKKMMIYLRGGGLCVPGSSSKGCDDRCSSEPSLCTASTDPDYILSESNLGDNIGSNKQTENPAFWDYSKIYVPYCSSDLYSGTASASSETGNRIFHGKHIVRAVIEDLIANTWIAQADQVTLIGTSAGAVGVEFNCDLVAEELHKLAPSLDIKCVADSGTINPPQALASACSPGINLVREGVRLWQGELDQSCVAASNTNDCIFLADSYSQITTPFMVMTSASDDNTLLDICALEEPINNNFLQSWKTEMGQLGTTMGQSRSDVGIFFDNCPFHVAVVFPDAYKRHSVPTIDGGSEKKVLRDLLYNFVKQEKPYQGVDDMTTLNPECSP